MRCTKVFLYAKSLALMYFETRLEPLLSMSEGKRRSDI